MVGNTFPFLISMGAHKIFLGGVQVQIDIGLVSWTPEQSTRERKQIGERRAKGYQQLGNKVGNQIVETRYTVTICCINGDGSNGKNN